MNRIKITVPVIALAALFACAPETGNIYGKHYHPSYVYATNHCVSYSKNGICRVNIPTFHTHPESFELCLDDGKEKGCREVTKSEYESHKIGDWYDG